MSGLPRKLWYRKAFDELIRDFGIVYEVDRETSERTNLKVAKLRIGVCKKEDIPVSKQVMFRNARNQWVWGTVYFEKTMVTDQFKETGKRKRGWEWVPKSSQSQDPNNEEGGENNDENEGDVNEFATLDNELREYMEGNNQTQEGIESLIDSTVAQNSVKESSKVMVITPLTIRAPNDNFDKGDCSKKGEELETLLEKEINIAEDGEMNEIEGSVQLQMVLAPAMMKGAQTDWETDVIQEVIQEMQSLTVNPATDVEVNQINEGMKTDNTEGVIGQDTDEVNEKAMVPYDEDVLELQPITQMPPLTRQSLRQKLKNPENSALDKAVNQKYKSISELNARDTKMIQVVKWSFIAFEALTGMMTGKAQEHLAEWIQSMEHKVKRVDLLAGIRDEDASGGGEDFAWRSNGHLLPIHSSCVIEELIEVG